jgi:hypothetical protein
LVVVVVSTKYGEAEKDSRGVVRNVDATNPES